MLDFLLNLFNTDGFPPRWFCGRWTEGHGWLHILCDTAIFGAYAAIPVTLVAFARKRTDVPFRPVFWWFAVFIASCGLGHLVEATIFWHPWYRLSGLIKLITACASWGTVYYLVKLMPEVLKLPGLARINAELQRHIAESARLDNLFESTFDNAAVGIALVDMADERWVRVNKALCALTGYSADEMQRMTVADIVDPEDLHIAQEERLAVANRTLDRYTVEKRYMTKSGGRVWVSITVSCTRRLMGGQHYYVTIVQDISARRAAETERKKLIGIIEQSHDFIATADLDGHLTYMNSGGRRMVGLDAFEPLDGVRFRAYVPESWKDMNEGVWQGEMQLTNLKTHTVLDVHRTTSLLRDERGQPLCLATVTRDITEAKRAAAALQESEEKMRLIFEAARDYAIYMLDLDGCVVSWNASAARLCGYAADEVLGKYYGIFFTVGDEAIGMAKRELAVAKGESRYEHDVWHMCKNGSKFWANVIVTAVYNARSEHVGFVRITRDFTERRNAQRALRRTEARFRALVEASAQVVWTVAGSGNLVEEALSWCLFTGQDYRSSYGFGWLSAFHPADPASTMSFWRDAVARRDPVACECRLRHNSGAWRWVYMRAIPLLHQDGRVREWVGMATDITEKKMLEERFRLAIEAAPAGMFMLDKRGIIVMVNAEIEKMSGYTREELIGRPDYTLVPERLRFRKQEVQAFIDGTNESLEGDDLHARCKDGREIPVEVALNPIQINDEVFLLVSVVDITRRRRSEAEKAALNQELQKLNADLEVRVQSRTRELSAALKEREVLLQEIHHRVKNNLQVISSLISLQVRKARTGSDKAALEECQTRVLAIALIHEKLYQSEDYSHIPFAEYVQMLASTVFQTSGSCHENVSLDLHVGDVALSVDKAIPCGLLINELISNALKHGFKDGRTGSVHVKLQPEDDGKLLLEVSDDGVGWPKEHDVWKSDSLGLQIVTALSDQLDAEVHADGSHGGSFQVRFAADG